MFDPRLISDLRRFSSREEAAAYLGLVGDLLSRLHLTGDDRRFHFNPTTGSRYFLPLTINNRYIIVKGRDVEGVPTWWLIHPGPHAVTEVEADALLHSLPFAHKRHDASQSAPMLVQYPVPFVLEHQERLMPRVLDLAARDLAACRGTTPCRASHNPLAYALALDEEVREEVLAAIAFTGFSRRRSR
ncbi:hypothetical protein DAETH_14800 [Deinococcus aetherius]|uniref:Uncharacterized protein n=1 Tax=Deinococcus aetherius TaxID=200252 RepID=A0ABM8ACJ0_9DEIO|nr:hypothetical protein [Deinococcus aetherius]BDP41511.1 hypothetical protein DAETH_14800 [Deinococcus aetherius]